MNLTRVIRAFGNKKSPYLGAYRNLATKTTKRVSKKSKDHIVIKIPKLPKVNVRQMAQKAWSGYQRNFSSMFNIADGNFSETPEGSQYLSIFGLYLFSSIMGAIGYLSYDYYRCHNRVNLGDLFASSVIFGTAFGAAFGVLTGAIWPVSIPLLGVYFGLSRIEYSKY